MLLYHISTTRCKNLTDFKDIGQVDRIQYLRSSQIIYLALHLFFVSETPLSVHLK